MESLTNLREQHRGHLYSPTYQKILFRNKKEFYCSESSAHNRYGIEGAQAVQKENIQHEFNAFEISVGSITQDGKGEGGGLGCDLNIKS